MLDKLKKHALYCNHTCEYSLRNILIQVAVWQERLTFFQGIGKGVVNAMSIIHCGFSCVNGKGRRNVSTQEKHSAYITQAECFSLLHNFLVKNSIAVHIIWIAEGCFNLVTFYRRHHYMQLLQHHHSNTYKESTLSKRAIFFHSINFIKTSQQTVIWYSIRLTSYQYYYGEKYSFALDKSYLFMGIKTRRQRFVLFRTCSQQGFHKYPMP